jgi:hypothetical protein
MKRRIHDLGPDAVAVRDSNWNIAHKLKNLRSN